MNNDAPLIPYHGIRPHEMGYPDVGAFRWYHWPVAIVVAVPVVAGAALLFLAVVLWVAGLWLKDGVQKLCGKN